MRGSTRASSTMADAPALPAAGGARARRRPWLDVAAKLLRVPQAAFGVAVIAIIVFAALGAPWIVPYDPQGMDFTHMMAGISLDHPLGSDRMGRDTLSRLIV